MTDTITANTSTTGVVTIGGSVSSAIDTMGDHDWFAVTLVAGQQYIFDLDGSGGAALSDPYLNLYNSSGTLLAFNDDANGSTTNSQLRFTATASGTYYLDAGAFGDQYTGGYTLSAALAPALPTYSMDQIATFLTNGYWYGNGYHFSTSTITFSVQGLTPGQQTLARLALQQWDDIGSFNFVETAGAAQIEFDNSGSGYAITSADGVSATVHISSDWNGGTTSIGSYTFQTYIHELGHALGLGHAGYYNGNAVYGTDAMYTNDSWAATVMSYFSQDEAGTGSYDLVFGPQMADILAIGSLYGLSTTTRTGDTVYGFNSNAGQLYNFSDPLFAGHAPSLTLFDNGGNDTLDVSGYANNQRIDLDPETWSDIGGQVNNIAIARGTIIENAVGGTGNDNITGNSADNILSGGDGTDTIYGGAGHDTLNGGNGDDTLVGNSDIYAQESDTLNGGAGNDTILGEYTDIINGGTGTDYLYAVNSFDWSIDLGTASIEWMSAGFGNDTITAATQTVGVTVYGGGGNDTITGSNQADTLWAGVGNDTVNGGAGDDVIVGDLGADSLSGGDGNDSIYADASDILLDGGNGTDALYLTAGTGLSINLATTHFEWFGDYAGGNDTIDGSAMSVSATVYAGAGNDVVTGGSGADYLWGEAGNDTLSGGGGNDTLVGGSGGDTLTGGTGNDSIYLNTGGGGDGAVDTVIFNAAGWGTDFIYDFEHGTDKLNLHGSGATLGTVAVNASAGSAVVKFGSDQIIVVGAGATFTTADITF